MTSLACLPGAVVTEYNYITHTPGQTFTRLLLTLANNVTTYSPSEYICTHPIQPS